MRGESASMTTRHRMSMVLPAENGTIERITLSFGQASARALRTRAGAASAAEVSARNRRRWMRMDWLPFETGADDGTRLRAPEERLVRRYEIRVCFAAIALCK